MTITLTVDFGTPIITTLNEKTAEGYDCLSLTVPKKSKKAELTFAPRAEDGIPYIYRKIEISSDLFQPMGWDFIFADKDYIYIRRPLPRLCRAEFKVFSAGDEKESAFLTEKAAEGYRLAWVVENQYLFVPCPENTTLTYRIDYGKETKDAADYIPPEQDDTDGDGMYFVCVDSTVSPMKYYFACLPLDIRETPPCGEVLIPPKLWEDSLSAKSIKSFRFELMGTACFCLLGLLMAGLLNAQTDHTDTWVWVGVAVLAPVFAFILPQRIARAERKSIQLRLNQNGGRVPRISNAPGTAKRTTTAEVLADPATHLSAGKQKKTLWASLFGCLALALMFTLFAFVGLSVGVGSLTEGFTLTWLFEELLWLLAGIVCTPPAVVCYAALFKQFKQIQSQQKRK